MRVGRAREQPEVGRPQRFRRVGRRLPVQLSEQLDGEIGGRAVRDPPQAGHEAPRPRVEEGARQADQALAAHVVPEARLAAGEHDEVRLEAQGVDLQRLDRPSSGASPESARTSDDWDGIVSDSSACVENRR